MSEPTTLDHDMLQFARRLLEVHELDSVVVLICKQEITSSAYGTNTLFANAGNVYAGKHLARRYAES